MGRRPTGRPSGRPTLPPEEKRRARVTVWLRDVDMTCLEHVASIAGLTPTEWAREALLDAVEVALCKRGGEILGR